MHTVTRFVGGTIYYENPSMKTSSKKELKQKKSQSSIF